MVWRAATLLWLFIASAQAASAPPAPTRWATDSAGLLTEPSRAALDARLEAYERSSGHQLLVWIGPTAGGAVENFAVGAFKAWKVGRAGLDDGLVVFIFTVDHTTRIEVGYGLEAVVTDAAASRILRDVLGPGLAEGRADTAVNATVDALVALTGGTTTSAAPPEVEPLGLGWKILIGLGVLVFLILLFTHPRLALLLLWTVTTGRVGGGGRSSGGGRSGGGGASGSW